jgi:hypothetical protein
MRKPHPESCYAVQHGCCMISPVLRSLALPIHVAVGEFSFYFLSLVPCQGQLLLSIELPLQISGLRFVPGLHGHVSVALL